MANDANAMEPAVLYKYLTAERAVKALPDNGNGSLRATQPAALNDPLECATRCSAVYSSDDKIVNVMVEALNSIVPGHRLTIREVHLSRRQLGTQAWNELCRKQLSLRFGVVSFARSALHPLLWAHYADSGTGVVIGYRVSAWIWSRLSILRSRHCLMRTLSSISAMLSQLPCFGVYTNSKRSHNALATSGSNVS